MGKNTKVYVNCPYDKEYAPLKHALMFAVICCGFEPWLVSMVNDAEKTRLEKIKDLIRSTEYGIHDISRCRASKRGEWYRMNMPFEMGLDFGFSYFSNGNSKKNFLVVTSDPYSLHPAFSDFSGNDPECHKNDAYLLINKIRDFFYTKVSTESKNEFISRAELRGKYDSFQTYLHKEYDGDNEDIIEMQDDEFCNRVRCYLDI